MQAFLQLPDDVHEAGNGALSRLQNINALDGVPELALLFEVKAVTLFGALDQHAKEAEEKLQILFGRGRAKTD